MSSSDSAVPGITNEQVTALRQAPEPADYDALLHAVLELLDYARNGENNTPRHTAAITRVGLTIEAAKVAAQACHEVGEKLAALDQTEALMLAADGLGKLADLTTGYRARLEQSGFSPAACEAMTIQFHAGLMAAGAKR